MRVWATLACILFGFNAGRCLMLAYGAYMLDAYRLMSISLGLMFINGFAIFLVSMMEVKWKSKQIDKSQ